MLKQIVEKNQDCEFTAFEEFSGVDFEQEVKLSTQQLKVVQLLQQAGGSMSQSDFGDDYDLRVLKALREKNVVKASLVDVEIHWALVDAMTNATAMRETFDGTISAVRFEEEGKEVYGYGWQTKLSKNLGVNRGTVAKWAQGKLDVPQYVVAFLATLRHCKDHGIPYPDFVQAHVKP